jgi:hypothetical protein
MQTAGYDKKKGDKKGSVLYQTLRAKTIKLFAPQNTDKKPLPIG